MQKTILVYITDSLKILRSNKVLLYTGLIDAVFFMALLYVSFHMNQTVQDTGNVPFYATGAPPPYLTGISVGGFIGAFLLAGKLYMIHKVYQDHHHRERQAGFYRENGDNSSVKGNQVSTVTMRDYLEGMGRYGLKILVGRGIIFIAAFFLLLPFALELLNSSNPKVIDWSPAVIFLITLLFALWDTIMIADDGTIKGSVNRSISFVKKHYPVVLGLQIFAAAVAFQSVLSPNVPLRMARRMLEEPSLGIEKTLVELPPLYQGILSTSGSISWGVVALLTVAFNVIAPMIFMDLYMDRRENNV